MIDKFLFLCIIVGVKSSREDSLIVSLPNGQISGREIKNGDNSYYAYQEIPYASPPVGNLRFKEPTPPQDWDGILDTTKNTKICHQMDVTGGNPTGVEETEDCLYLNVYTPRKPGEDSSELLPVLFWIHGGAFTSGSGVYQLYGPKYLVDHDIVVVSINYRLGPLGFLTTNDGVIPANLGLKDQNFALAWANQNIELFGGDPTKITIVGESAGAGSVGHLLLSKKSNGLFRGAIMESGTSICYWSYQPYYTYYAYQMGSLLNENININSTSEELLEVLQSASVSDIMNANITVYADDNLGVKGLKWTPVIEDESQEGAIVIGPMEDNLENGNINKVPILIGFNSEEELLFLQEQPNIPGYIGALATYYDEKPSNLILSKYKMAVDDKEKAGSQIKDIYTKGLFNDDIAGLVKYLSDEAFTTPVIRHAAVQSNYTDVYLYELSYKGQASFVNIVIEGTESVGHAEDLMYLWDFPIANITSEDDNLTRRRLTQLWTNFVKDLNPTPVEDDLFDNILWPKVSPNNIAYLNINATLEVKTDPKRYNKWKSVIDIYAIPPLDVY